MPRSFTPPPKRKNISVAAVAPGVVEDELVAGRGDLELEGAGGIGGGAQNLPILGDEVGGDPGDAIAAAHGGAGQRADRLGVVLGVEAARAQGVVAAGVRGGRGVERAATGGQGERDQRGEQTVSHRKSPRV
ncbi:MAG: hypothetical protein QM765_28030 [Myxococcales bacterium]